MRLPVGDLPSWSLPPSDAPKAAAASGSAPENAAVARLKPVGSTREDAKRASRVLLQAVIENYADRDSFHRSPGGEG